MTDEEKINDKLRQCGIDTQSATLDELKRRYPQYVDTDAQIEKQLARAASNGVDFCGKVLNYINRLKSEIKRIQKNWDIAVKVQRAKWQAKVKRAGKDTAKEILQDWYDDTTVRMREDGSYIIVYAKKYGVEIDQ